MKHYTYRKRPVKAELVHNFQTCHLEPVMFWEIQRKTLLGWVKYTHMGREDQADAWLAALKSLGERVET